MAASSRPLWWAWTQQHDRPGHAGALHLRLCKNFINYSSPAYDALFQQAINATDEAAQTDLYKQMETMLADTAANVYIQDLSDLVAMRQDLGGLKFYPIYVLDLSTVYLTQQ